MLTFVAKDYPWQHEFGDCFGAGLAPLVENGIALAAPKGAMPFFTTGLALRFNALYNIGNMLKKFLMKKMMKSQLKNVPEDQQEKILKAVEENPDLFQSIGLEIQAKMKEGKDQMSATMEVIHNHQEELRNIM